VNDTTDTSGRFTWRGWALRDGVWACVAEAEKIGAAHRLLLAATATLGLKSHERFFTQGGHPPAPARPPGGLGSAYADREPAGGLDAP
jgi:hypothetical protein